jgi:hypothetical protein
VSEECFLKLGFVLFVECLLKNNVWGGLAFILRWMDIRWALDNFHLCLGFVYYH